MLSNISYKFSTFADYSNIMYSQDNIRILLDVFGDNDFLPGMVNQIAPDARIPQRLQLSSANQLCSITILNERIDMEIYSDQKSGFPKQNIVEIRQLMAESMQKIYKAFEISIPDAYRLAWNVAYVYFEVSQEEMMQFRSRFLKDSSFYQENATDEFIARFAGRVSKEIGGRPEMHNVLTTIERLFPTPGIGYQVDGYKIGFDINTHQANRKNRFTDIDFKEFITGAYQIQNQLESDFFGDLT